MRYIGGKHRVAKPIAAAIHANSSGRRIVEPFCGSLSATVQLQSDYASDSNGCLIELYRAVRSGWTPPTVMEKAEYLTLKDSYATGERSPLHTFAAVGCSFGGKWWGGYASGGRSEAGRNFCAEASRSLLRKVSKIDCADLHAHGYQRLRVRAGDVLYCDPPYAGRTNGYKHRDFDTNAFWDWVRWCVRQQATVYVSEFQAPDDAELCRAIASKTDLRKNGHHSTLERLYIMDGYA